MGSLGKVKVDDVIRIPSAVKRFFDLKKGDFLEFLPYQHIFDKECMVVVIVRKKGKRK